MEKEILVCLDRDGTINKDPGYFGRASNWKEQLEFYPGVIKEIERLNQFAYVVVISNQAGVARGFFDEQRVKDVNQEIDKRLRREGAVVDNWSYCLWVGSEYAKEKEIRELTYVNDVMASLMRKPATGMVSQAICDLRIAPKEIYFIGDKSSDVQTGLNAGGVGVLFYNGGNGGDVEVAKRMQKIPEKKILIVKSLEEAARVIENLTKI